MENSIELKNYGPLKKDQVIEYLPHRDPFLFVDEIKRIEPGKNESGESCFVGTEVEGIRIFPSSTDFYRGHFPGFPITPGVIIVETAAQVGGFSFVPWLGINAGIKGTDEETMKLVGINHARFRRPVLPNDELQVTSKILKYRKGLWTIKGSVEINGKVVADLEVMAAFPLMEILKKRAHN